VLLSGVAGQVSSGLQDHADHEDVINHQIQQVFNATGLVGGLYPGQAVGMRRGRDRGRWLVPWFRVTSIRSERSIQGRIDRDQALKGR
jgi:hypothetical protein